MRDFIAKIKHLLGQSEAWYTAEAQAKLLRQLELRCEGEQEAMGHALVHHAEAEKRHLNR
jgi:hypothetical protein